MPRLTGALVVALMAIACPVTPARAGPTPGDAAATHRYLEATSALHQAEDSPAALEGVAALEAQVKVECPDVLAHTPSHYGSEKFDDSRVEVSEELYAATFGAAERVEYPAFAQFAHAVQRLRWTDARLTRRLRSLAAEQAEEAALPAPALCADLTFWVASGYTAASAETTLYIDHVSGIPGITTESESERNRVLQFANLDALDAYRLRPYEDRRDRLLAKEVLRSGYAADDPRLRPLFQAVDRVYLAAGSSPFGPR